MISKMQIVRIDAAGKCKGFDDLSCGVGRGGDLTGDDQPVVVDFRLSVSDDTFQRGIVIG